MFYFDKNIGKIKCSNKTFDRKKKAPQNKGLSKKKKIIKKIFPLRRKELLNSYNIVKSSLDHEEESWNLGSCIENASVKKWLFRKTI